MLFSTTTSKARTWGSRRINEREVNILWCPINKTHAKLKQEQLDHYQAPQPSFKHCLEHKHCTQLSQILLFFFFPFGTKYISPWKSIHQLPCYINSPSVVNVYRVNYSLEVEINSLKRMSVLTLEWWQLSDYSDNYLLIHSTSVYWTVLEIFLYYMVLQKHSYSTTW